MNETVDIAKKYASLHFEQLTEKAVRRVKECFLDYLGCALAGYLLDSSRIIREFAKKHYAHGGCTILGEKEKINAAGAAFINGSTAHGPELDDLHKEGGLHVGVVIFPVALSVAETRHLSGRDFITAAIAGYDVAVRVGRAANPNIQLKKGFHPTSTCGVFGASMAASRLMDLKPDKAANALGIAGSFASGSLECYSDGSLTKRINPGIAASSGVISAELAALGYTGPKSILEGPRGFLKAYSGENFHTEELIKDGNSEIDKICLKLHASCGFNQAPIDATLKIRSEHQIDPADIKLILIELSKLGYFTVGQPGDIKLNPRNEIDAQFSAPYSVAVSCIAGKAHLTEYSLSMVCNNDVRQLLNKISVKHSPYLDDYGPEVLPAKVTIEMNDGRRYSQEVQQAKGDSSNPLSWEEIIAKFRLISAPLLASEQRLMKIVRTVESLDKIEDMREICSLLT